MYFTYETYGLSRQEVTELLIKAGFKSLVQNVYMRRSDGLITRIAIGAVGVYIEQIVDNTGEF